MSPLAVFGESLAWLLGFAVTLVGGVLLASDEDRPKAQRIVGLVLLCAMFALLMALMQHLSQRGVL